MKRQIVLTGAQSPPLTSVRQAVLHALAAVAAASVMSSALADAPPAAAVDTANWSCSFCGLMPYFSREPPPHE